MSQPPQQSSKSNEPEGDCHETDELSGKAQIGEQPRRGATDDRDQTEDDRRELSTRSPLSVSTRG